MSLAAEALRLFTGEETEGRLAVIDEEITARSFIAEGNVSIADVKVFVCPPPNLDHFYGAFLRRKRLELTEKYQDLITRQMLREDRWLEYTVLMIKELIENEAVARRAILIDSVADVPRFVLVHLQLQMISAQGTEGTVIYVEEMEREIRFRVMIFEEIEAYEFLVQQELDERAAAKAREVERLANEADARGIVGAAEWNARWLIEREEEKEFELQIPRVAEDRCRIIEMYLWRVMQSEAQSRWDIEECYSVALYGHKASRKHSPFADEEMETGDTALPEVGSLEWHVAYHEAHFTALMAETRRIQQERDEARAIAALAFHMNHPIDPSHVDPSPSKLSEDDDSAVSLFGFRFGKEVFSKRPKAWQEPHFTPPPPAPQECTDRHSHHHRHDHAAVDSTASPDVRSCWNDDSTAPPNKTDSTAAGASQSGVSPSADDSSSGDEDEKDSSNAPEVSVETLRARKHLLAMRWAEL